MHWEGHCLLVFVPRERFELRSAHNPDRLFVDDGYKDREFVMTSNVERLGCLLSVELCVAAVNDPALLALWCDL
jgi:hypothetical protein